MEKMKDKIIQRLQDEESKYIFENRVNYSESNGNNYRYIWNIVETTQEGKEFLNILNKTHNRTIFGAGLWGKELFKVWEKYEPNCWKGVVDNNYRKYTEAFNGVTVDNPSTLKKDVDVFIITRLYYAEIKKQLDDAGIDSKHIINVGEMLDKMAMRQYFDLKEMYIDDNEVFLDVGAFDGKTSLNFINWCNSKFKKIYCFEADEVNAKRCETNLLMTTKKIEIIPKGAYSKACKLRFDNKGNGSSSISEDATSYIETETIDKAIKDERATFIKMDIEGAEMEALLGCKDTIKKYKPKLAISVYHKLNDIIDIPDYILSINPEYKLYLRHYSLGSYETVLYAI